VKITPGDLDDDRVTAMLRLHACRARAESPPCSAHALDPEDLRSPEISFWTIWEDEALLGVGALMRLTSCHAEVKSMYVAEHLRGKGLGSFMLLHLIDTARSRGFDRVSLETGSMEYFRPARRLYERHGFVECEPFGKYVPDPNSIFMTVDLQAA
jgi:putative acetyltransferase